MDRHHAGIAGLTLIELLVVLAVIGMMLGLGLPAWGRLVADARMADAVASYHQAFNSARLIAVQRRRPVTICPLGADNRCAARWGARVDVFFDDDRDGQLAGEQDYLALFAAQELADMMVQWRGFGRRDRLTVNAEGHYRQNGRFRFCMPGDARGRSLVINAAGRVRTERVTCAA
jgi:type IV fimbrial biogenesis protein FimT